MLKNKKGFTLIEIVIVIVIIAILAAILVPNLTRWIDKARLATLKSEADTVRTVITSQIAQESKEGLVVSDATSSNISTIDPDFWDACSKAANTDLQMTDENQDGYVKFIYDSGKLTEFVYASSGHKAILNEDNSWKYE